jgi:hypothetical protein
MSLNGFDFSKVTDDQVLFFIRIRGKKSYFNNVYTKKFLANFTSLRMFRTISEYKKDADVHINLTDVERDWLTEAESKVFDQIFDIDDIVLRCRGLRDSNYMFARKLVFRAFLFFENFYRENPNIKLIVCGAVDNFVMDVMHKLGCHYGIEFIGVTDSFMSPEYKLITVRGESSVFGNPTDDEVRMLYERLRQTALSPNLPSRRKAVWRASYALASYIFRFTVRYLFYYRIQGKLAYEYIFAPLLKGFSSIDQLLALRYLRTKSRLKLEKGKRYAYLPLHYVPEATTDYWIDDLYHVDYLASVLNTTRYLQAEGFEILVKEHPAFYLARSSDFYKILERQGCQILTPFIATVDVFAMVDLVVVWNGSTGIEAIVHEKPVVKVTNSYYGDGIIPELTAAVTLPIPTAEMGLRVVKKVLESSFRTI